MLLHLTPAVFLLLALCVLSYSPQTPSEPSAPPTEQASTIGKKLFMEKCGKCHDERGDKSLASGPPLNERILTREKISEEVNRRFRQKTEDERAAVVAYIEGFLKTKSRSASDPDKETE
jgi:mono/diheme cytochrome c family protein